MVPGTQSTERLQAGYSDGLKSIHRHVPISAETNTSDWMRKGAVSAVCQPVRPPASQPTSQRASLPVCLSDSSG